MVGGQKPHARPAMRGQWAHGCNRQFIGPPFRQWHSPSAKAVSKTGAPSPTCSCPMWDRRMRKVIPSRARLLTPLGGSVP